jgi:hypothetical protein
MFDGGQHGLGQRLAVGTEQAHDQLDGRLPIGRHRIAVDFDHHARDFTGQRVADAGLFTPQAQRWQRIQARRQRVQAGVARGGGGVAHVGR